MPRKPESIGSDAIFKTTVNIGGKQHVITVTARNAANNIMKSKHGDRDYFVDELRKAVMSITGGTVDVS